jgi:hypothetical protein
MDGLNPRHPLIRRILASRWVRYPCYVFLILTVIGLFIPDDEVTDSLEPPRTLYAGTNPWRDLPADQEVAVKEVRFIAATLRDTFLPTSLPEEDDYEFLSKLMASLETRGDISWSTLDESGVASTMSAIANRRGEFAREPFRLTGRFWKLSEHWSKLQAEAGKPEKWEVEHYTTFVPPLLKKTGLDGEGPAGTDVGLTGILSEEQKEKMEESYSDWKTDRDLKVAYLKTHPPKPMAWVPLPKTNDGKRAAWEEVVDGDLEAGKRVVDERLVDSPRWKPIYRDLMLEDIPMSVTAGRFERMTSEESDRFIENLKKDMELRGERVRRQRDWQDRMKSEREQAKTIKVEL